jgi:hypothetical protein
VQAAAEAPGKAFGHKRRRAAKPAPSTSTSTEDARDTSPQVRSQLEYNKYLLRNLCLLRKRSRVRFPLSANIYVHEHVCLYWVWVFLQMQNFAKPPILTYRLKKKNWVPYWPRKTCWHLGISNKYGSLNKFLTKRVTKLK